jgi:hypothetical protein
MYQLKEFVATCCILTIIQVHAFAPNPFKSISKSHFDTNLFGGVGTATNYSWKEGQYEIELKVKVPKSTTAKQINYKARSKSIHLTLGDKEEVLLDGSRVMRGMIDLDGTFWSIIDSEEHDGRDVVINIEKLMLPPKDPFEVVEFDWNGIYPDDEEEIIDKKYDEPEEMDIKEYAASLGVDIDNINMTMVDKSMFSSGLNMTRNTLDDLTKSGYVKEVTRQGDGTELVDQGSGKTVPFSAFGEGVSRDEIDAAGIIMDGSSSNPTSPAVNAVNPYMTKDSPWLQSMPAEEARTGEEETTVKDPKKSDGSDKGSRESMKMQDPIDLLTVVKMKEILKKEGLKVSGNKTELQDRLKGHVKSVMEEKREGDNWQ